MTDSPKKPAQVAPVYAAPERAREAKERLAQAIEERRRRQGHPPSPPRWMH